MPDRQLTSKDGREDCPSVRLREKASNRGRVSALIRRYRLDLERDGNSGVCGEHQDQRTVLGIDGAAKDRLANDAGRSSIRKGLRVLEAGKNGDSFAELFRARQENHRIDLEAVGNR